MIYITDPNSVKMNILHIPRDNDEYAPLSKSLCGIRKRTKWKLVTGDAPTPEMNVDGNVICQNCLGTAKMQIKKRHFEAIWKEQYKARRAYESRKS